MENKKTLSELTVKELKDSIGFEGELKQSFDVLIDCWYGIKIQEGHSHEIAIQHALDNLSKKLSDFGKG